MKFKLQECALFDKNGEENWLGIESKINNTIVTTVEVGFANKIK